MRALSTGSCHAVYLRAGSQDWAKTYVTVPAGGWMVAQGNIPYCTTDGASMKFGDENILDYSGAAPWNDPHGQLIASSLNIPKAVGSGQKDQTTWVSIFGLNCCTREDEVDGGVPGYTGSCNAPNNSLFSMLGQDNSNIIFLFYPDGRIRLLDAISGSNHLYSGTAGLSLCTPTAQRFTVYVGSTKTFNNNLSKSTAGSEKDFADLQYSITIDGNTGRVRVQKGW
jgi:hypothetical protein